MSSLLALARVAASEAVRSRTVAGLAGLLAIALALVAAYASGDGSPIGSVRAKLSAGLDASQVLVELAAVFLATAALSAELDDGRFVPFAVAPVRRWQILFGKWLGLGATLAVLLAVSVAVASVVAVAFARRGNAKEQARLDEETFTARTTLSPPPLDVSKEVDAKLAQLVQEKRLEKLSPEQARAKLETAERIHACSVARGRTVSWELGPVPAARGARTAAIRFRYRVLGDLPVGSGPKGELVVDAQAKLPITSAPGASHEVLLPVGLVEGKERVRISYTNLDPRPVTVVFPPEGVELLLASHGFAENALRAFLVFLGRVLFLVAVGLSLSAMVDGKVAAFTTFTIFLIGAAHGFLVESTGKDAERAFGMADAPVKALLQVVLGLIPDLGSHDPATAVGSGLVVDGVATSVLWLALGLGGAALALGSAVLAGRELALREARA